MRLRMNSRGEMGTNALIGIAALGVVTIAGGLIWKMSQEKSEREVATVGKPPPPPKIELPPTQKIPADYAELVANAKLLPFKTNCREAGCQIAVSFVPEGMCQLGDIDLIEGAMKIRKQTEVLVTIEEIDDLHLRHVGDKPAHAPAPLDSKRLSIAGLRDRGQTLTFDFKPRHSTRWGLYVCTDMNHTGTCSDKSLLMLNSMNEAITAFRREKAGNNQPPPPVPKSERVFYFQPIFWEAPNEVLVLRRKELSISDSSYVIYRYLHNLHGLTDEIWKERSQLIKTVVAINALPLKAGSDSLLASLPYYDAKSCPARGKPR